MCGWVINSIAVHRCLWVGGGVLVCNVSVGHVCTHTDGHGWRAQARPTGGGNTHPTHLPPKKGHILRLTGENPPLPKATPPPPKKGAHHKIRRTGRRAGPCIACRRARRPWRRRAGGAGRRRRHARRAGGGRRGRGLGRVLGCLFIGVFIGVMGWKRG